MPEIQISVWIVRVLGVYSIFESSGHMPESLSLPSEVIEITSPFSGEQLCWGHWAGLSPGKGDLLANIIH